MDIGQIATLEILANHLQKKERWVRDNLVARGCPCRRCGQDYLFSISQVIAWIEGGTADATDETTES